MMWLQTERLLIRRFVPEDETALFAVLSDPEVMRFLEPPFDRGQTAVFLREAGLSSPPLIYALECRETGRLIGYGIFHPYYSPEEYELGWVIRRDCWGQGFAEEVTGILIAQAGRMGLESLVIEFCLEQRASRRLAEKFGFYPAGIQDGLEVYRYFLKKGNKTEGGIGMRAICGLDCTGCGFREKCGGCAETGGKPFGGSCVLAECCRKNGCENCGKAFEAPCRLKEQLIREFNALGIADMEEVKDLNALAGSYINLEYTLPSGQKVKLWDDSRVYLGNQLCKKGGGDRCYGLTADENYLLVCEYGDGGSDPEIVVYKKRGVNVVKKGKILLISAVACAAALTGCSDNCDDTLTASKPAIYLYPEEETAVSVQLDYAGELTTTYPAYGDGWEVLAQPDGTLTNLADGKEYSYLFWEGESRTEYDFSEGFVVKGSDTAAFLQETLSKMGMTPREYNEMIVYWLPKMEQNPYNLVSFQAEAYTETAKLRVSPEPDSVLRVFMAWKPLEKPVEVPPQEILPFEREGFTVVEWGGTEVR